jgi:predicted ABC-type ATPase
VSARRTDYQRPQAAALAERLDEPRRFLQVVAGPRQVGKSTLVQQVTDRLGLPVRYVSADEPTLRGTDWISNSGTQRGSKRRARRALCSCWMKCRRFRSV